MELSSKVPEATTTIAQRKMICGTGKRGITVGSKKNSADIATVGTHLSLSSGLQMLHELQQGRVREAIHHRQEMADHEVLQANAAVHAKLALQK